MRETSTVTPMRRPTCISGDISLRHTTMAASGSVVLDVTLQTIQDYYDAIIADDSDTVDDFLSVSDDEELFRLLNSPFRYPPVAMGMLDVTEDQNYYKVRYPVVLAGVVGSLNVLDLFLEYGADFSVADEGENILHALCFEGFMFPTKERHVVATYDLLLKRLPHDVMKGLLIAECGLGARPIELASVMGCYELIEVMFNTQGVYLAKVTITMDVDIFYY